MAESVNWCAMTLDTGRTETSSSFSQEKEKYGDQCVKSL